MLQIFSNMQVYMSSSGLDWSPIFAAWLKHRHPTEVSVFQQLFEETFPAAYSWSILNLNFVMKVLQCNIIQQVIITNNMITLIYLLPLLMCLCNR